MFNFDIDNYKKNIAITPRENWQGLHQATLDDMWDDTTQIYTIKEQNALPFTDEYTEYEAWISTVSDDLINYSKVYSEFVRLFYRDLNHKQNYKGQYYKLNLDGKHEETYICYDRMNLTTLTADFPSCFIPFFAPNSWNVGITSVQVSVTPLNTNIMPAPEDFINLPNFPSLPTCFPPA